jgi:hypothetical protein
MRRLKWFATWLAMVAVGAVAFEAQGAPPVPVFKPGVSDPAAMARASLAMCLARGPGVPYDLLATKLTDDHGEARLSTEYLLPNAVAELWVDRDDGSFTIVARSPIGRACLAAAGTLPWHPVREMAL